MKKNQLLIASCIALLLMSIFMTSCSDGNTSTGLMSSEVNTIVSVSLLPDGDNKTTPPIGWMVKLHANLRHFNPVTQVITDLEPFTPMDLGIWNSQSVWGDFSFHFVGMQHIPYGVRLAAQDPSTGHYKMLDTGFTAVATYSDGTIETIPLNRMFQATGGMHDGRNLHGGDLYGFQFISGWHIEPYGEYLVSQRVSAIFSFDGQANFTVQNGQLHYIPADSLYLYAQPVNQNYPHIVQCSQNFFKNSLGYFNPGMERHEFEFSLFPGQEFELTIVQEAPFWEQKQWGINVSVGSQETELMNLHNFGTVQDPWTLFIAGLSPSGIPYNIFMRDDRMWGIFEIVPGVN